MRASPSRTVASFGSFQLDIKAGELHCDGRIVRLPEQPFRILRTLIDCPGEVVTREELCRVLWANNTIVDFDQSINAAIKKLRIALGDSADKPVYVETLARRGYRLIVPVQWKDLPHIGQEREAESETINREMKPRRSMRVWAAFVAISSLVLAGSILWLSSSKSSPTPDVSEFRQRQLTANSTENQIWIGTISPDGKYLAYSDLNGIHIKIIDTGE